ncbi:hypothetical protein GCM10011382_12520 [Vreelandella lutescens]|uniref:Uncharacterized protein n=1 Tax=Vreelandella lutescens TaxID=1602943 RepID=A0ABQ1NRQ9_9GAMM|nr:hypothetical protein GCM10011382_12520 [Halomonas lutescens]
MKTRQQSLLDWLRHASDDQVLQIDTTCAYLRQIAYGHKQASPEIAARIERATAARCTRKALRPKDWSTIWPELAANTQQHIRSFGACAPAAKS